MSQASLKKQLKTLKQDKGIQSRKIGDAKKSGQDATLHIQKVRDISQAINKIEALLKQEKKQHQLDNLPSNQETLASAPQFTHQGKAATTSHILNTNIHDNKSSWDEYVSEHANATIYHSWTIKEVIENSFAHNTFYLSAVNDQNEIQGVLPLVELKSKLFGHSLVSVPFFNYGGMLASSVEARSKLLQAAVNIAKKLNVEHIEFRDCQKFSDLPAKQAKVSMLLNLPTTHDILWQNLGTKLRAQIKKAERNNLVVKIGKHELLNDFYKVFSQNMRDLGTPVYSKALFSNMLSSNKTAHIALIYHNNKPVSCGFILGWKNTMEIPWASTLRSANKLDANMKLYWEILKFTTEQGYELFDFGRSSKDANTYKFKKQWGAKPHPLYWHYWLPNNEPLPEINPNNPKFKLMIAVWQKLPVWLANIIGPPVVKNLP